MKLNFNKIILAALLIGSIGMGCEKQLEIDPSQSIDSNGALSTRQTIDASITAMYASLKSARLYGRDLIALPEALGDNGYATNKSGRLLPESNNNFGAHFTGSVWTISYQAINQINLTLEAIPSIQVVPAVTTAEIAAWEGQLYFLRGLYYFELMKAYAYTPGAIVPSQDRGGVPVLAKGTGTLNAAVLFFPTRESVDSVYMQIVSDFKRADARLLSNTSQKSLATKGAAQAMLSRAYLYTKDYANAKLWSDNAIATMGGVGRLTDQNDYVSNWRSAENKETIFQVKFTLNSENIGVNESLQTSFTTLTAPGITNITGGFGDLVPTISLLNDLGITLVGGNTNAVFTGNNAVIATRSTDVRNQLYEPGTVGRGKSYVEVTKYLGKNGFINLDNIPVIRMSELYLNRAEAAATAGSAVFNLAAALADLKEIKSRRYVGYTGSALEMADNALTQAQLYEEILRQRRIELAFEGQRFHDIKRLGRNIIKSPPSTQVVLFTDARILAPIFQPDVDGNPNLKQNFGY
ncbi:MAG: RagB/SusD family nutrient uptake outer membrane protein [Ferruginibacter sp.]